jgi:hypothetical protein
MPAFPPTPILGSHLEIGSQAYITLICLLIVYVYSLGSVSKPSLV